jgi:hypothetical protein
VQIEFDKRKKLGKQYSGTQIFGSKLVCGDCGCFFGSKVWHSTSKYRRVIWQCNSKFKGSHLCTTPHLYEEEIKQRFINAFSEFFQGRDTVIETVQVLIETLSDNSDIDAKIESTLQKMSEIAHLNEIHIQNNVITAKNKDDFDKRHEELAQMYESKKAIYDKLMQKKNDRLNKIKQLRQIIIQLTETDTPVDTFDENLWRTMIEKVTVFHDNKMIFQFLDGTEIEG